MPLAAHVLHLLERRGKALARALDVLEREVTVLVQHLSAAEKDVLPLVGIKVQLHPTGNVLPQVEEEPAVWGLPRRWREALVHRDRHVVRGRGDHVVVRRAGVAGVAWHARGIDDLAVLVVGKEDGTVVRPLPVRAGLHALHDAIGIGKLELRQELGLGAVLVEQPPRAA